MRTLRYRIPELIRVSMRKWLDGLSELERQVWERITGQKRKPQPIW